MGSDRKYMRGSNELTLHRIKKGVLKDSPFFGQSQTEHHQKLIKYACSSNQITDEDTANEVKEGQRDQHPKEDGQRQRPGLSFIIRL